MLSFSLSPADGVSFALQLGLENGVLGFVWWPFPVMLLGCMAMCAFAGMSGCRGARYDDPRGGYRRGPSKFWTIALIIAVLVLMGRGVKEHVHTTIMLDSDNHPVPARVAERRHERLEDAVARLERQLDRASDQVDRALERSSAQIDRQVDHSTDQMSRQLDKGAADMAQQLEHAAAQLIREIEHLGHQIAQRHRDVHAPRSISVPTQSSEATVTEPSAPALPVPATPQADMPKVDVIVATAPPAAPAHPTPPSTPAATAAAPVAASSAAAAESPKAATAASATNAEPSGEKLPEWTKKEIVDETNRKLVVVQGGFAGTQSEAEQDTLQAARLVLGDAIQRKYPEVGKWLPPVEAVRDAAVRLTYVEKIPRKTLSSGTPFVVYRAYKQVELSPVVYSQLLSSWKGEVVPRRLEVLAGFAALLTLTFATGAAYFRLDDRTQGRYRGRLKVAAVAVIGAGAAAAAALI